MKTKILSALMAIALIVGLTSCNDSNNDAPTSYLNFMTLKANTEAGCVLEMYNVQNKTLLTYTSDRKFDEKSNVKVGERVLVMYGFPAGRTPYTSGTIDLIAYRPVANGAITWENTKGMKLGELQSYSVSIEGAYLNYEGQGVYYQNFKTLRLVADEATVNDKMPVVYLQYDGGESTQNGTWKAIYGSFNISEIWSNAKYEGFTLRINDTNSTFQTLTFKRKDVLQPVE